MDKLELLVNILIAQRKKLTNGTQVIYTQINEHTVVLGYTRKNKFEKDTGIFITKHSDLRSDYTFITAGISYDFEYYIFPYTISLGRMTINQVGQTNGSLV